MQLREETMSDNETSFETAMAELEGLVEKLEDSSTSLDEAVKLYERGQELRKICQERLQAAQDRIDAVISDGEGPITSEPFHAD
jgi:exodeoxyribonuclease VII, small subunit|tara:strand:+ start:963 stop:1214 length:252 start_codon:yes stop_codon:yes gene_type:complete